MQDMEAESKTESKRSAPDPDDGGEKKRVKIDPGAPDNNEIANGGDPAASTPKPKWQHENIPNSSHYHISWMHADIVTFVKHNAKHGYIVTGSRDGVVKFWKRLAVSEDSVPLPTSQTQSKKYQKQLQEQQQPCLEFVKSFTAHEQLEDLAMEDDWCASVGKQEIQIFDVRLFDSLSLINTKPDQQKEITYSKAVWFGYGPENAKALAVSVKESGQIYLYSAVDHAWMPQVVSVHGKHPVTAMAYDRNHRCIITADNAGILEVWDCQGTSKMSAVETGNKEEVNDISVGAEIVWEVGGSLTSKRHGISYSSKLDTDLYTLVRKKTFAKSIAVCGVMNVFCVYGQDDRIRVFDFKSCKTVVTYDERLKTYDKIYQKPPFQLDSLEYGTRAAKERQMQREHEKDQLCNCLVEFDPSGRYLLVSTMMGIKVIDWEPKRHKLVCIIGKDDASQLRFTSIALCPGKPVLDTQMELARKQQQGAKAASVDPDKDKDAGSFKSDALLVALADQQRRFYVFSQYDLVEMGGDILTNRDVWNEAPSAHDYMANVASLSAAGSGDNLLKSAQTFKAILRTSMGDIHLQLFAKQTPKTVENFVGHAKAKYYDGVIFHRVLKGFMIQTGDPLGDGTGGESIWGGDFNDEFVQGLRHDRPFVLSMANAGPNTNGSQFFITTVPCPWLDQKHTIFGRVTQGMDVCTAIENVKTDHRDKPLNDITILSIDIE